MSAAETMPPPVPLFTRVVMLEWHGEPMRSDTVGLDPTRPWEPLWLVLWRRDAREWLRLKAIADGVTP